MSLQLDRYLAARASGAPVEDACEQSGIGRGEAELWEAAALLETYANALGLQGALPL